MSNQLNACNEARRYVDKWWEKIRAAQGSGKKVRIESDHMTIELMRAFKAGWIAAEQEK